MRQARNRCSEEEDTGGNVEGKEGSEEGNGEKIVAAVARLCVSRDCLALSGSVQDSTAGFGVHVLWRNSSKLVFI